MSKLRILSIFILLLLIGINGCAQPKTIEFIRLVQVIGYDHYGQKDILGTIATPIYAQTGGSGQVQPKSDAFSVIVHKGHTLDDALEAQSEYPLQIGKLMAVLYEDKLAKTGIYPYIDILNRNPDVGRTINLAIVDGKAEKIINAKYSADPLVSMYLGNLLKQETKANFPDNNLHEFLYSYYGEGMDPFLPLIKKVNRHVEVEGIALFQNDNYVGSLPYSSSFAFKMLFQSFKGGTYTIPWDKNHFLTIRNIKSKVNYDVKFTSSGSPIVTIHVKQKGLLRENSAVLTPQNNVGTLKKIMKKSLEKEGNQILNKLKKLEVDPLRIGDHVRSYDRNWDIKKWKDIYPNLTIKLNVDVNLAQTGIIE